MVILWLVYNSGLQEKDASTCLISYVFEWLYCYDRHNKVYHFSRHAVILCCNVFEINNKNNTYQTQNKNICLVESP